MDLSKMNLSFSGCGFLCIYHAGVCAAIKEYAPHMTRNVISGASAGSIAAAGLICDVCVSQAASTILDVVAQARSKLLKTIDPTFNLIGMLREGLHRVLPDNAHVLCTGKLKVSLTRVGDGKNVIVSEFNTKDELIQALICSSFIPFYCGLTPPKFRGIEYYDGGLSDNQPLFDENSITVSPFSGESDICPADWDSASYLGFQFSGTSIRFTTQNLYRILACLNPPSPSRCAQICRQGFEDALRFLTKNGITPCARCLTIQSDVFSLSQQKSYNPTEVPNGIVMSERKRIESECERCFEKVHPKISAQVTTMLFPSIVQRKLDDAIAAEYRFIDYLYSFRVVKWSGNIMASISDQLELTKKICYYILSMILSTAPLPLDWFMKKLQEIARFILSEIEKHETNKGVKHSCELSVLELNYGIRGPGKKANVLHKYPSAALVSKAPSIKSPIDEKFMDDEDSISQLLKHSREHDDAIFNFYFTDNDNNIQICEIFDISPTQHSSHKNHPACIEHEASTSHGVKQPRNQPMDVVLHHGDDSGISAEDSTSSFITKRDACCSPVRHLSQSKAQNPKTSMRANSLRSLPAGTRRGNSKRGLVGKLLAPNKKKNATLSSDSDADVGEVFFVSSNRHRTSSNEYDGEPEDTDQ